MQSRYYVDPIPHSIWHTIIQDMYINFEKLYATMNCTCSHQDESKDFVGGFALVRKDVLLSRKMVRTEGEWIRLFEAWRSAVVDLFPHRSSELERYRAMVIKLFCTDKNKINVVIEMLGWIKYHNQLQSTNNILYVCLS